MPTATRDVEISALDPATLSDADAAALAGITNAADAVDAPHLDPVDASYVRHKHAHGHDLRPTHGLLVARTADEQAVGYIELYSQHWDNPQMLGLGVETHPDHRGRGVGDALLKRAVGIARAEGRTQLLGDAWADSHRARFWERHQYPVAARASNRRLVLTDLNHVELAELLARAEGASPGYELVDLPNPAPDELVDDLLTLHLAMNDEPLDDLQLHDAQWPADRFRAFEQAMTVRGCRLHRLLARCTSDGELGGHTVVVVEEDRPWVGFQEDTAVVAGHRGHKLGLRLKIEMLALLAEREPQLRHIDTWNADSNRHMIAVNDAIGCVVVGRGVEVQRELDR